MSKQPQPGDYVVFKSTGWAARCIQWGTRSRWNHAAIFVGDGYVIEAQPSGVQRTRLNSWAREDYVVATGVSLSSWQRLKIVRYAEQHIGAKYGWLDIVALTLVNLGIGSPDGWIETRAKRDDRLVCSQLVAYAYDAAGYPLVTDAWTATPGDLADRILTTDK